VPDWQSGDLVQVALVNDPARPRDYSIASIPSDGELQLLVRQERHPDGTLGAASGLLTSTLALGDSVAMRLRPHGNFRLDGNAARPLILIGNGTGLAGLRGHLRARAAAGQRENWLLFGERKASHDFLCRGELEAWRDSSTLRRLDMVFSRDQAERLYVQHRLLQLGDELLDWLARGAAIYVCGSLQGMAAGVDAALRELAGDAQMRALAAERRYCRDVY
jgi:sulfite reductase (NADPH) flavoprotein alpha-component